jgi:hypothetical protein
MIQALAFVPLLIYGFGISKLLSEWGRLFDSKKYFLPYLLFTIMLTEVAVYSVFVYTQLLLKLPDLNYLTYLSYLIPPFLFFLVTNVFTPDKGADTKEYFIKKMPLFFILLALFFGSQFLYDMHESNYVHIIRLVVIVVLILTGLFYRKVWITYVLVVIWLIAIIIRGNMVLTGSIGI